jgi:pimeloyl-ACP methyl ester carboxylesterase
VFTAAHRGGSGTPLVCLHGFTGTWRAWELVLPALERVHDVWAPTLPGHAGGPPLTGDVGATAVLDRVERAMDEAGLETAHLVGNSLGGYLALRLAERGRARSVVALAPAGGWAQGDPSYRVTMGHFTTMLAQLRTLAVHADAIAASPEGRRRATRFIAERSDHIPTALVVHQMLGAARCPAADAMIATALRDGIEGWTLDAERIACPVRIVWGTEDRLLQWPSAAVRYRREALPHADWVVLDGVGHCPQLDVPLEAAQLILGLTAP